MATALGEAVRVTQTTGVIYIAEPLALGTGFELHAPIDDETRVRALALQALNDVGKTMVSVQEITYTTNYFYKDYDEFRDESIRIDPARQEVFDVQDKTLRANFDKLGVLEDKGYRFDQPMRVNILNKS